MSQQAPLGLRQHLAAAFRQSLGWLQGTSARNTVFTTHVSYCSAPAHIIAFILRPSVRTWYQPLPQGSKRQCPGSPVERGGYWCFIRRTAPQTENHQEMGLGLSFHWHDALLWFPTSGELFPCLRLPLCIYPKRNCRTALFALQVSSALSDATIACGWLNQLESQQLNHSLIIINQDFCKKTVVSSDVRQLQRENIMFHTFT